MNNAKIYKKMVTIPTYGIGNPDKNPMFFEKRVYQGSSGKVYPYPIIDTLINTKTNKNYTGIYLENDYIKILVLPEIGGKIHSALDKTNGYNFVYQNDVIKPALVGLLGPWVSGGIEFNWPQHHRPTTFMKSEVQMIEHTNGSVTAKLYDFDRINGTSVVTSFTLFKDKSYIHVNARLFNPTCENQTFLWWANPAVAVNDNTQSIFPPDVTAVYDHGKRAVSKFPIATGEYYKHDYSMGVDISRYKNIPVPTSYMAYKSKYDFVGNYDYKKKAGLLHVANHLIAPGKKQWTWGNGDFGQAWDRNLTDSNGPYIELMTGVYTDNQPDFSWLRPFEEKEFEQYFMPYKEVGAVKNANSDFIINLEKTDHKITMTVYATGESTLSVILQGKKIYLNEKQKISPVSLYQKTIKDETAGELLTLRLVDSNGKERLSYTEEEEKQLEPMPQPQTPAEKPENIKTVEELYLTGQHIEQYRHATFIADDYYREGLKRDPEDSRCNDAIGLLCLRRGQFTQAEKYFVKALKRLTKLTPNPYDSQTFIHLGFALWYQGKDSSSYQAFFKATWMENEAATGYYMAAVIDTKHKNYERAFKLVNKSLQYNTKNYHARALKALLMGKRGDVKSERILLEQNVADNTYDYHSLILLHEMDHTELVQTDRVSTTLNTASYFIKLGEYELAASILSHYSSCNIMVEYYKAYVQNKMGIDEKDQLLQAKNTPVNCYFPSTLQDQLVLNFAIDTNKEDHIARYLLGNIYYANTRYEDAYTLWRESIKQDNTVASVHRNLSLVLYNKQGKKEEATKEIETAFALDQSDARTFYEQDQLYKKNNVPVQQRMAQYNTYFHLVTRRDDLKCEYVTMLNILGENKKAYNFIMENTFTPWEGGEGKISTQYVFALREMARTEYAHKNFEKAKDLLLKALTYPHNLGEGKLEGDKSNDIFYYLGLCYQALDKGEKATDCFMQAIQGSRNPQGVMYYNDQSADMIYYQGLAYQQLGNTKEMKKSFYQLIDYGENHYFDHISFDYFAVSLPDLQLFEDDLDKKNKIHCAFLLALGYLGLNNPRYKKYLDQVIKEDNSHFRAALLCDKR